MKRSPDSSPDDAEDPAVRAAGPRAVAGNGDAGLSFRQVFERYQRPLWRFFARRGCSPAECDDLTQETFLRVYTGMDGFRGEARFETWLFRIAINSYRKSLRYGAAEMRSAHEVSLDGPEHGPHVEAEAANGLLPAADGQVAGPLGRVLEDERRRALAIAVTALPDQMRRCVLLRIYQDLPYKEIAAVMRVSIETVKAHLFQARKRLKDELAGHFERVEL